MINRLINLLKYVESNNLFYSNRFKNSNVSFLSDENMFFDKFINIPVLNKKDISSSSSQIISNGYQKENLEREQTSGSTGVPLWIYKTKQEIWRQSSYLWQYRFDYANILPKDRYIRSYISQRKDDKINIPSILEQKNCIALNMLCITLEDLNDFYKSIIDFKPKWLFLSPSFLYLITNYIKTNELTVPQISYIELTGEYITDALKNYFFDVWKCKIGRHYGCREVYGIAVECSCNHLHVITDNVFVEIDNKDEYEEGFGEVVVTSLSNKAMPLIRYNIGDIGRLNYSKCECGNKNPYLELSCGRQSEYIEANNKKIHSSIFHFAIKKVNMNNQDAVLRFQVKKRDGNLLLLIEIKDGSKFHEISEQIRSELNSFIQNDQYMIEKMDFDSSYIKNTGKFAYVI